MKSIKVQQLTEAKFRRYGQYAQMINPTTDATGPTNAPIVFYRDMVQQEMFGKNPSFSVCRMEPRPLVIDMGEYHNYTCELSMPIDNDAICWVAPADCSDRVPVEKIEAFFVPRGTILMLRPGVWHHAHFALNDRPVNVMIVLPERAYMTDCHGFDIPDSEQLAIEY